MTATRPVLRSALLSLALCCVSFGTWWAWLGWDHEYYTDPSTGYAAGPYRPWQVIGCVVTLLVLAALAYTVLNPVLVGVSMTIGFTAAFASTAVPDDESGLAMVGVLLVLVGMSFASLVLGLLAWGVRSVARRAAAP